ncbi:hypothetical protein C0389_01800 [bacterium]|nr:hypothetical protein [bacterium]
MLNGKDVKKILLVDDSSLLRNNLKRIIASIPNLNLVGEAVDSTTTLRLIDELKPDVMVLDINLMHGSGIEVLSKLKKAKSRPITIIFTNYSQAAFRKAAEKLGVNYFFDKNEDIDNLFEILKRLSFSN